ncbi:MAG: phospholipid carrier-dependent glycosyltransferase [Candidatus Moranbacteria bacterium]|nr:phospholipid carrier-dependent glycosyltransferase [Candidatus Moranbacteria bacterium]
MKLVDFLEKKANLLVGLILLAMFFLMVGSMRMDAAIRDEMPHIVAGYSYWTKFDYRLNPEHPPLIKQLSAFPLLFMEVNFPEDSKHWKDEVNDQWALGEEFLYYSGNDADKFLFWGRLPIVLLTLLSGFFIFRFASEIFKSKLAGLAALVLYAFSPNIMAHGRYITTDMGVSAVSVIALYYWFRFLKEPGYKLFFAASIMQGLLHLSKFSSPLFMPAIWLMAVFAILLYQKKWDLKKRLKVYVPATILSSIIALLIVGFWYTIFMHKMPLEVQHELISESIYDEYFDNANVATKLHALADIPVLRPYAQYFLGFFMVAAHASYGHDTYFMGEVGQNWPHYYFVAYLLKEPIASQVFLYVSIILILKLLFDFSRSSHKKRLFGKFLRKYNVLFVFFLLIAGFMIMGMRAKLQLGIRYIVPVFPYLYIIIAGIIVKGYGLARRDLKQVKQIMIGLLLVWLIGANLAAYPYYLAYFNEYVGGYKNGWKYLIDSNLDWGQDLRRLKVYLDENQIDHIKIDYFGGGNLDYYLGEGNYTVWGYDKGPTDGWIAVSVNAIQWNSSNTEDTDKKGSYHWLTDNYEPVEKIGGSIFVYKVD